MNTNTNSRAIIANASQVAPQGIENSPAPEVEKHDLRIPLAERAILINLSISQYGGSKKDKTLSHEFCATKNASESYMGVQKRLLVCDELKAILNHSANARNFLKAKTLPWTNAMRIVPSSKYVEVKQRLEQDGREFVALVEKFLAVVETVKEQDRARMGTAFSEKLYPTVSELRRSFAWRVEVARLPEMTEDFRLQGIDKSFEKEIVAREKEAFDNMLEQSKKDVCERLLYGLQPSLNEGLGNGLLYTISRLKDLEKNASKSADERATPLRASVITGIQEMASTLRGLNFAQDAGIDALMAQVETLFSNASPKDVRDDKATRALLIAQSEAKVAEIEELMGSMGFGE